MKVKYVTSQHSITGVREKEGKTNEDSFFIVQKKVNEKEMVFFAGVADGMGGLNNGKEASRFVAESLETWFRDNWEELVSCNKKMFSDMLLETIRDIHYELRNKIENEWNCSQAGSTLSLIYTRGNSYIAVNIGDSRIYLVQGNEIKQITHDQTYAQQQIDLGNLKEDEVSPTDKSVHVLLQAMGASTEIAPDFYFGKTSTFFTFFLCSDGMINRVSSEEVLENLKNTMAETEKEKIVNIMKLAITRGEMDNMTGIVIKKSSTDSIEEEPGEIEEPKKITIPSESNSPTCKI